MAETIKKLQEEIKRLSRLVEKKDGEIERLKLVADRDFMTGLYNRNGFLLEAEKFLDEVGHSSHLKKEKRKLVIRDFSVIFIDLDDLKKINDLYGHKAGDDFIKAAAEVFNNSLREFDVVSRWGGDEFVIGLVDADENEARKIAFKIKKKLGRIKLVQIKGKHVFTASFGVISAKSKRRGRDIFNLFELIEKADMAMYEAKKNKGKNFIFVLN